MKVTFDVEIHELPHLMAMLGAYMPGLAPAMQEKGAPKAPPKFAVAQDESGASAGFGISEPDAPIGTALGLHDHPDVTEDPAVQEHAKRHRRTKKEMEAARAAEEAKAGSPLKSEPPVKAQEPAPKPKLVPPAPAPAPAPAPEGDVSDAMVQEAMGRMLKLTGANEVRALLNESSGGAQKRSEIRPEMRPKVYAAFTARIAALEAGKSAA